MSPIATAAEAECAIDELTLLIAKLSALLEQETELVNAGRIRTVSALQGTKAELAAQLSAAGERVKARAKFLRQTVPARCAALVGAQNAFRTVLQKNMIVLATSHAVSEGIMRRLSSDLARKAAPQVYGASGRTTAPNPRNGRPLAVSRTL
jgi:phosphoenolpyruvate-protein kinase (PTS system EI component)